MIPLGDSSRRPINFPIMTAAIIAVNAFVFVLELMGGDALINCWSLVPADIRLFESRRRRRLRGLEAELPFEGYEY